MIRRLLNWYVNRRRAKQFAVWCQFLGYSEALRLAVGKGWITYADDERVVLSPNRWTP